MAAVPDHVPAHFEDRITSALRERGDYYRSIEPDRGERSILRAIRERTRIGNQEEIRLATYESLVALADESGMTGTALQGSLSRLITGDFMYAFFCFEFRNGALGLQPCFAARREDLRVLAGIFEELLERSMKQIELWVESLDSIAGLQNLLQGEGRFLDEDGILIDEETILRLAKKGAEDFPIRQDFLKIFATDVRTRLLARDRAVEFDEQSIVPFPEKKYADWYDAAAGHLRTAVTRLAEEHPDLARTVEEVRRSETEHQRIPDAEPTVELDLKRADLILQHDDNAPNLLAARFVRKLYERVRYAKQSQWKERIRKSIEEFRDLLYSREGTLRKSLRFLSEKERYEYHPVVWQAITTRPDEILHALWETKGRRMHVFAPRDFNIIKTLVSEFMRIPGTPQWQLGALLGLIEAHREKTLKTLFFDDDFMPVFAELQKKVYTNYLPFLLRLLMGLPFLVNFCLRYGENKMREEQHGLAVENAMRPPEFAPAVRSNPNGAAGSTATPGAPDESLLTIENVTAAVEKIYQDGHVATFSELASSLGMSDSRKLQKFLEDAEFKQLSIDEHSRDTIVLFRRDARYPHQLQWLRPKIDEILNDGNPSSLDHKLAGILKDYLVKATVFHVSGLAVTGKE